MDAFNKAYGQVVERWRAATPRARLGAVLLFVVVAGSLVSLGRYEMSVQTNYLLGGQVFSVDEITTIQGALGKAQLSDFTVEGNRIRIPQSKQAAYLAALADGNALPQTISDIFSEATDKSTWFTSRQEQIEHAKTAKKKVLSQILRSMNGVEGADVDFDKEEPRGLKQERIATALVAVRLRGEMALTEDRAACFQRMAAAMLLMAPQDVTVVDKETGAVFGGRGSATGASSGEDVYRARKRQYQADYEQTIRDALAAHVRGVTVSANVELEKELRREERRVEIVSQGGANQPANLNSIPRPTADDSAALLEDFNPSRNQTTTESVGLTPKRVTVSIGVPTSHFESVWRQRNSALGNKDQSSVPAAELARIQEEEIGQIRAHVAGLLPAPDASGDTSQLVTVTPFSHVVPVDAVESSPAGSVTAWLTGSWLAVGAIGAMFSVLAMLGFALRSRARRMRTPDSLHGARVDQAHEIGSLSRKSRREERPGIGNSLREELVSIVREDPAKAASILRSWIGNIH